MTSFARHGVAAFAVAALISPAIFAATPAPAAAAITEAECAEFGEKIADLFNDGEASQVVQLLDVFGLVDRITPGLGYTAAEERDFRAGVLKTLAGSLGKQFATFTSAQFLRVQTFGTERRALVRLVSDEGAANYMGFICTRRGTGAIRWSDAFTYLSGETISQTTRRTVLPLVAESKKGVLEKLTRKESVFVRGFRNFQAATALFQKNEAEKAWAECERMPAEMKKDRTVLLLRLRIAQAVDDKKYLQVIQDWEAALPGDPTLDFVSIDGDILRQDYAAALKHVDSFAKQIGGDAYLDFLAANVLTMAERYDEAKARARAALRTEPTLTSAYDALLNISLKTKNHAETAAILDELKQAMPGMPLEKIVADESYADFRASEVFRAWPAKDAFPPAAEAKP